MVTSLRRHGHGVYGDDGVFGRATEIDVFSHLRDHGCLESENAWSGSRDGGGDDQSEKASRYAPMLRLAAGHDTLLFFLREQQQHVKSRALITKVENLGNDERKR